MTRGWLTAILASGAAAVGAAAVPRQPAGQRPAVRSRPVVSPGLVSAGATGPFIPISKYAKSRAVYQVEQRENSTHPKFCHFDASGEVAGSRICPFPPERPRDGAQESHKGPCALIGTHGIRLLFARANSSSPPPSWCLAIPQVPRLPPRSSPDKTGIPHNPKISYRRPGTPAQAAQATKPAAESLPGRVRSGLKRMVPHLQRQVQPGMQPGGVCNARESPRSACGGRGLVC